MTDSAKINKIVVPLDGSDIAEQALDYAAMLAAQGTEVLLVAVAPAPDVIRDVWGKVITSAEDVGSVEMELANSILNDAAQRWQGKFAEGLSIKTALGDPATEIVQLAEDAGADLIAMTSNGRGGLGRIAYGSVTDRVTRTSSIPVMVIHAASQETVQQFARIVVPIDGSDLAFESIPVAIRLAKTLSLPIHLVQVINPAALISMSPIGIEAIPAGYVDDVSSALREDAQKAMDVASDQIERAGLESTGSIIEGAVVPAIESEVQPGDLIVMTSHGRSGVRRLLLGSVADKIVRSGIAPVVLVPNTNDDAS